jgi:hypothetical protein
MGSVRAGSGRVEGTGRKLAVRLLQEAREALHLRDALQGHANGLGIAPRAEQPLRPRQRLGIDEERFALEW